MKKTDLIKAALPEIYAVIMLIALGLALSACAPSALDPLNPGSHSNGTSVNASENDFHKRIQNRPDNIGDERIDLKDESVEFKDEKGEITELKIEDFKADWDKSSKAKKWTGITLKALKSVGQDMVVLEEPKDVKEYCPKYKKLGYEERLQFYVMLVSSMARFESGFDPKEAHTEDFKDSDGKPVVSRGLMQMSYESALDYGCEIKAPSSLHNEESNLKCAVKALNSWVKRDKRIGSWGKNAKGQNTHLGGGRYWSVLRKTSDSREKIQNKTKSLDICS